MCVGSTNAIFNNGPGGTPAYGAVYVYNSLNYAFSFQQVVTPPATAGSPALVMGYSFGAVIAASRRSSTAVLSGTNLFVGAPFTTPQSRGDEAVFFYSATMQTAGVTVGPYSLVQTLRLQRTYSTMFGSSMAVSADDSTIIVGAPGYVGLPQSNSAFTLQGPLAGAAYVFQWVPTSGGTAISNGAYTMLAILQPPSNVATSANPNPAQEAGFGVAVAMSGNIFAVASLGSSDLTGQLNAGTGLLYIYTLGSSAGGQGQASAASVPRLVQRVPNMPVSNPLALSMSGNFLIVGVQRTATVQLILNANALTPGAQPDYAQTLPSFRTTIAASTGAAGNSGMGQVVTSQMVNGRLYVYIGQPNANTGQVYISANSNSVVFTSFGVASGLLPGFGCSVVFNSRGNYMYAGNFINQPHALVLSIYFEQLGAAAVGQRLVSNDAQTAGAGVFSNFGSVVAASVSGSANIIAVGASLGPTNDGRVYLYTLMGQSFSLQAVLAGTAGSNFGSAVDILNIGSAVGIVVGAPNVQGAYVNLYLASQATNLGSTTTPYQQLVDPRCVPITNTISCGANFGGSVVTDNSQIIVGAHNFGLQPGTGRVYVYRQNNNNYGGIGFFSLQQTINSPPAEYGFGVSVALTMLSQNAHQRPLTGMTSGRFAALIVASSGLPQSQAPNWPNMPNNVGGAYVYVRVANSFSILQMLINVPCPLVTGYTGTGSTQALAVSERNIYIGSVWRNMVYVFQYNGISRYSQQQVLQSPNGLAFGGAFGSAMYANPANNGLAISAPLNGTVFFYSLDPTRGFLLIRVLSAAPSANSFGAAIDFSAARFIIGAPGANVAGVYMESALMALPFAQPSPSPTGMRRKATAFGAAEETDTATAAAKKSVKRSVKSTTTTKAAATKARAM